MKNKYKKGICQIELWRKLCGKIAKQKLIISRWSKLKSAVEDMLNFLTGDHWIIEFRSRDYVDKEIKARKKWERVNKYNNDISKICMFSGGLDSCIGALDLLSLQENKNKTLFISHYGGGKGTKEYQDALKVDFIHCYGVKEEFADVLK